VTVDTAADESSDGFPAAAGHLNGGARLAD